MSVDVKKLRRSRMNTPRHANAHSGSAFSASLLCRAAVSVSSQGWYTEGGTTNIQVIEARGIGIEGRIDSIINYIGSKLAQCFGE